MRDLAARGLVLLIAEGTIVARLLVDVNWCCVVGEELAYAQSHQVVTEVRWAGHFDWIVVFLACFQR